MFKTLLKNPDIVFLKNLLKIFDATGLWQGTK